MWTFREVAASDHLFVISLPVVDKFVAIGMGSTRGRRDTIARLRCDRAATRCTPRACERITCASSRCGAGATQKCTAREKAGQKRHTCGTAGRERSCAARPWRCAATGVS